MKLVDIKLLDQFMVSDACRCDLGEVAALLVDIVNRFSQFYACNLSNVHFHGDDIRRWIFMYTQRIECTNTGPFVRQLH